MKIIGTPESQWRAQFYIYDRIRSEGILGSGEVHLRSEIAVPSQLVGRIIGKRGQRVCSILSLIPTYSTNGMYIKNAQMYDKTH